MPMTDDKPGDRDRRAALLRSLCARLEAASHDELRVIDRLYQRLEKGRGAYGPLNLAVDGRDWRHEQAEEREDQLIYGAFYDVAEHARRVEAIAGIEERELQI